MAESWEEHIALYSHQFQKLEQVFKQLDADNDGRLDASEIKKLAKEFYDGREPSDQQVNRIIARLDANGDGTLDLNEVMQGAEAISRHCCVPEDRKDHVRGWSG